MTHRVSGSRWLPHMTRGLDTLFRTYPAFISQLQDASHTNAKASGLARLLENSNIITYAAFLQDIISHLVRLSLDLQRTNITLSDAKDAIAATKVVLSMYVMNKRERVQGLVKDQKLSGYTLKH